LTGIVEQPLGVHTRLSRTIVTLYAITLLTWSVSTGFALYQTGWVRMAGHPISFVYPLPNDAHDEAHAACALAYLNATTTTVWQTFLNGNLFLLAYACAGVSVVSAMFFYLYRLSHQLINAQTDSRHDALTGLHNRRALDEQLPLLMRQSQREQSLLTVLFIDIDHFRLLNERYGHESGDVALQAVAKALASVCQRPRDFICRWGGEEFVAVLPHTDVQAAEELAQRMLQTVRDLHLQVAGHSPPKLTVSIGHISTTVTPRNQDKDLIGAADQAMLLAKHRGRNQSVMATTSRTQRADNLHVNQDDHP
jgi:diguanylate cyclase (GGDEF)-like protein